MIGIGLGFVKGGGAAAAATPWYSDGVTIPASSGSATVTADTLAHTKGAWTEIIASNGAATNVLQFNVSGVSASSTDTATLVDFAVGASGSEVAIAENIAVGGANKIYGLLPLAVASGARVSARIQSVVTGGKTATVQAATFDFGGGTVGTVDILGTSTGTSEGTTVTSSYTEVVASTSNAYAAVGLVVSVSLTGVNSLNDVEVDLAVGGAGSEVAIHRTIIDENAQEYVQTSRNPAWLTAVAIAAGSRLSAKVSGGSSLDVTVIGVRA